jgi:predicted TPR repeat methyltransferase
LFAACRAHFLFSTEFLPTSPGNNNNNNNNSSSSTSSSDGPNNGQGAAGYQLQATGRFAHSTSYLQHLGESCGWRTLAVQERVVLRYNSGEPIYGNLCVMQLQ